MHHLITPSEICRILHILRKQNSLNCFIIQSKYVLLLKGVSPLRSLFLRSPNITQSCPQVFSVNGSIICSGRHFWRHFDVISSIIFGGLHFWRYWFNMAKILFKFGEQQLVMVNYACGFNRSHNGDGDRKSWDAHGHGPMIWGNFSIFRANCAILTSYIRANPRTWRGFSRGCCHVAWSKMVRVASFHSDGRE